MYSTLPYSIDSGGFDGDLSLERTDSVNAAIRSRSIKGSSYFHENFPEKILRQPCNIFTCCLNQNISIHRTNSILIFSQAEILVDYYTPIYIQDMVSNCPTCNSNDVEFDNTISRVVCMGCGKELPYSPFDIRNPEFEVM